MEGTWNLSDPEMHLFHANGPLSWSCPLIARPCHYIVISLSLLSCLVTHDTVMHHHVHLSTWEMQCHLPLAGCCEVRCDLGSREALANYKPPPGRLVRLGLVSVLGGHAYSLGPRSSSFTRDGETLVTLGFALLGGGVEGSLRKPPAREHRQAALSRDLPEKRRGSPG